MKGLSLPVNTCSFTVGLALLFFSLNTPAETAERYMTGYAYDLKSNTLLYSESHQETYSGDTLLSSTVSYRFPDGKTFATKHIDFSAGSFLPNFKLEDSRQGYIEGGKKEGDELVLFTRDTTQAALKEKRVKPPAPAVADAGFNLFIKAHWDELLEGKTVKFNFAVPVRRDYYQFNARKIQDTQHENRPAVIINVEIASTLLGLFADPIVLTYDLETHNLVEYRGLSNLPTTDGTKNYLTRIVYPLDKIGTATPD